MADVLDLHVKTGYTDPEEPKTKTHRTPARIPSIELDEGTLLVDQSCVNYNLQLVDSTGSVVFSHFISEDTDEITIPSDLIGSFELQLVNDHICFYCEIEL